MKLGIENSADGWYGARHGDGTPTANRYTYPTREAGAANNNPAPAASSLL